MEVLTPEEMRRTDRIAIDEMGVTGLDLMERAGSEVGRVVRCRVGIGGRRIAVLCGKGNNGGDGFVAARWLASRGALTEVFLFCRAADLKEGGNAAVNFARAREASIPVREMPEREGDSSAAPRIRAADVIIDALLGTGFAGVPRGRIADAIELVEGTAAAVVAVDAPSGVNCLTGGVEGKAIRADWTVTLCRPKVGLYLYPGRSFTGEIVTVPIGAPAEAISRAGARAFLFDRDEAARLMHPRARDAHKGHFGRILVAGGSPDYTGAPLLAGRAALRSGAGLVTLGVPASLRSLYAARVAELMTFSLADRDGLHTAEGAERFLDDPGKFDVVAIGPGLSRGSDPARFVDAFLDRWKGPLVIDADGIHGLAGGEKRIANSQADLVLTPHMGEMERLTGASREEILVDRTGFLRARAEELGVTLLLKGNPTLVASPDGFVSINTTGNPGMATAGSGDVLTGVIAAFLGAGLAGPEAARLGVWVHGRAGDIAAGRKGESGAIAGDQIESLPDAILPLERRPA